MIDRIGRTTGGRTTGRHGQRYPARNADATPSERRLRRRNPAFGPGLGGGREERARCEVDAAGSVLTLSRQGPAAAGVRLIANLTATPQSFTPASPDWRVLIDSEDTRYAGSGTFKPLAAYQAVLYEVGE